MEENKKPDEEKIPRRPEPISESAPKFLSGDEKKPEEKPVAKPVEAPVQQESPPETKKAPDNVQPMQPAVAKEKTEEKKIKEAPLRHKTPPVETPKIEVEKTEKRKVTEKPKKVHSRKPIIFTFIILAAAAAVFLLWPGISKIFTPQRKTQLTTPIVTAEPGPAEQLVDIGIPVLPGVQAFVKDETDGLDSITFVCDMAPEDVALYYIKQLGMAGWGIVSRQGDTGDAEQIVVFRKDGKEYVLMAVKRQDGQTSAWFTLPRVKNK